MGWIPSPLPAMLLRDYLTDLFPIMELGTSAKMLSIVPMLAGRAVCTKRALEVPLPSTYSKYRRRITCAGTLWVNLWLWVFPWKIWASRNDNPGAQILAKTLDLATGKLLENNKSPSRKTGELDNRGSHFYLGMYWAQVVAEQTENPELAARFAPLAKALAENEDKIIAELRAVQGRPAAIQGYYHAERDDVKRVMRPSETLNAILAQGAA